MRGEANILSLAFAIAKGMVTQVLLNCALTAVLGEAATTVLKIVGIAQNADSFIEAVESGDPERIIVESIRLAVSLNALKSQCFTGDTLVSTADGDRRIDEIEAGDYVWSYDTDGIWVAASNLLDGNVIQTIDSKIVYVEEVRIEKLSQITDVYNLEIEDLHTYYVDGGILVHNMCVVNKDDDRTANEIISQDKKASIRNMFPKELLDKTLKEIEDLAKKRK